MDIFIAVVVTALVVGVGSVIGVVLSIRNNKDRFDKELADANAKIAYLESVKDNLKK